MQNKRRKGEKQGGRKIKRDEERGKKKKRRKDKIYNSVW